MSHFLALESQFLEHQGGCQVANPHPSPQGPADPRVPSPQAGIQNVPGSESWVPIWAAVRGSTRDVWEAGLQPGTPSPLTHLPCPLTLP